MKLSNRKIWVTGASSGIGQSLAEKLLELGNTVILSARRKEALNLLAKGHPGKAIVCPLDVTDKDSVLAASRDIQAKVGRLDIAILNAGSCQYIDSQQFDADCFEDLIRVNTIGFARCVEVALPLLRKSARAQLVGVSSSVVHIPLPRAEAYGASKAAVAYLMESLRVDLFREGINVSVVYPGFVKTPLTDRNDFAMPMMVPVDVSTRHIIEGIRKRKKRIDYPVLFSLLTRLLGGLPIGLRTRLLQKIVRPEPNHQAKRSIERRHAS